MIKYFWILMAFLRTFGGEHPLIVAHRGASYDAPENTLSAFRLAWEKGADAIEGDFYITRDGTIVCIHDATTKRTAKADRVVAESDLKDLRSLEYGSWKAASFQGEPIPTLLQVLETVPSGKKIYIEIKCGIEIVTQLKKDLESSGLKRDQLVVICFDSQVVAAVKREFPWIKAFWLTSFKQQIKDGPWTPSVTEVIKTLKDCGADGLGASGKTEVLTEDWIARLRKEGFEWHVWTVDDPDKALLFRQRGVDSITTNRPAFIRRAL